MGFVRVFNCIYMIASYTRKYLRTLMRNMLYTGQVIVISVVLFFAIASYAILLSPFLPLTGILFFDVLAKDTFYKYFVLLLIPTTSYFVISNWVGWQYYRNS